MVFQALENGAYLAGKGVLGWDNNKIARAWVWSSRAWMAHVALELARLGYEWRVMNGEESDRKRRREMEEENALAEREVGWSEKEEGQAGTAWGNQKGELELREEKVDEMRVRERWANWQRELGVNLAYAPMTLHYSLEEGPLGEGSLGVLGFMVGWLSIGRVWRDSA